MDLTIDMGVSRCNDHSRPFAEPYIQLDTVSALISMCTKGKDARGKAPHPQLKVRNRPMGIGMRPQYREHDLKPGQCISNEPGFYKDGHWGIRIENLVLIKEIGTKHNFGGKWLGAERVTMAPIQTKLVDKSLMNRRQIDWLNAYNKEVEEKVSPLLKNDERALAWLRKECKAI